LLGSVRWVSGSNHGAAEAGVTFLGAVLSGQPTSSTAGSLELASALDFAAMARELQSQQSERGTLRAVCALAKDLLKADEASFTTVQHGRFRTLAMTGELPLRIDEIQYALDEGPCVDAFVGGTTYRIEDLRTDQRWPRFAREATERTAVRSMLSHHISVDGDTLGSLNLYAVRPSAFGPTEEEVGQVFATHAALAVQAVRAQDRAHHLEVALKSNRRIGTAVGILMARNGWTEEDAFTSLRRHSQDHNIRIAQIAEQVILTGEL
jgi:GAF domain-containing protein